MDTYIWGMAWFGVIIGPIAIIVSPALVGKKREPYTVWEPVKYLMRFGLVVPLYGRLLGWW